MPQPLASIGPMLAQGLREFMDHPDRFPPRPTPEQARSERLAECDRIRSVGGTPWQVWTHGYYGMGASIPACAGVFDAPSFEGAVAMAVIASPWMEWDGTPYYPTEIDAWAAHDAHWAEIGGIYAPNLNDHRRPKPGAVLEREEPK